MKVLVYEPFILWNFHFGTTLEIANNHLIDKDEVHFLFCNSSMKLCQLNRYDMQYCVQCIGNRYIGLELLENKNYIEHFLDINKYFPKIKIPNFENTEELKSYKLYGINFGLSVLSSLITMFRESKLDFIKLQDNIKTLLKNSISIYFQTLELLKEYNFDKVYIFNGRFFSQLPVIEACKKMKIDFYSHERTGTENKYSLAKNNTTHSLSNFSNSIEEEWNKEKSFSKKFEIANKFYIDRIYKNTTNNFIKEQIKNKLPDDFDKNKYNIVIYDSSLDEFEAVEDFENNKFKDIYGVIEYILDNIKDENIQFYLRVHPNLKNINNSQTDRIKKLNYNNLTVIEASSNIDTYSLMELSNKIITFGSTTGIEANFMEKIVISIGISYYDFLNIAYIPKDYNEIIELIKNKNLSQKNIEGSIKFGYWNQTYGYKFKNYKQINYDIGLFKNEELLFNYKNTEILSEITNIVINNFEDKLLNIETKDKLYIFFIIENNNNEQLKESFSSLFKQTYISNIDLIIIDFIGIDISSFINGKKYEYIYSNDKNIIEKLIDKLDNGYYYFIFYSNFTILINTAIEYIMKKIKYEKIDIIYFNKYYFNKIFNNTREISINRKNYDKNIEYSKLSLIINNQF